MSKIVIFQCGWCRKEIEVTDTNSLYYPDGQPRPLYHADCYHDWRLSQGIEGENK